MTRLLLSYFAQPAVAAGDADPLPLLSIFAAAMNLLPLVTVILSFIVAAMVIGAAALGLYLLFAPADTLVVTYQNYHLRRSMRPLKDEDFGSYSAIVRRMRSLGVVSLLVSVGLILFMVHYFEVDAQA